MRALVTGSSGFVGRHFVKTLQERGYNVNKVDIVGGLDCRTLFKMWPDVHYDLVIHCAANVGGRLKIDGSPLWIAENLSIDVAMFQWALKARPEHIVYFSSSAAYPIALQQRGHGKYLHEDMISDLVSLPDSTYGWSKLTGERLAKLAVEQGLKIHIVRPFSGYGEDQSREYPFGAFLQRVVQGDNPFEIWGDGTQVRHWIHIDDIVEAVLLMVERKIYGPVNLAAGEPITFLELAEKFFHYSGRTRSIVTCPEAPTGVHYRAADTSRLQRFYVPKISIDEGIQRALAYRRAAPPAR